MSLFGQGRGPIDSFAKAGPALGAKLEYVLETGSDFEMLWSEPN